MDETTRKIVLEIISTALSYSSKLKVELKSIQEAEEQVTSSTRNTISEIDATFDGLTSSVVHALNQRRHVLKAEATKISGEGSTPLRECRDIISEKLKNTKSFIEEGNEIIDANGVMNRENSMLFIEKASFLGSLPAVPNLEEVPNLSFQSSGVDLWRHDVERAVSCMGRVSRMGPVQISCVEGRPGALLVHWEEVEAERAVDIACYRLQQAYGDVRDNADHMESNSHNVYVGAETRYLVRNLETGAPYTFRVCCRVEGEADWSAWSLPRVAATDQQPFSWSVGNPNYAVTNECKIASKVTSDSSTLFSASPQFGPGHSIEFTVLECGGRCTDEGLGLVANRVDGENLVQPGILFLSATGRVFVDGREKTTKLPALEKGSKVSFTCEHLRDSRIRVNIDSCNKSVTYDWNLATDSSRIKLYFAIRFGEKAWKVLVE